MDRFVTTFLSPDGPWAPRFSRRRLHGIIFAFAMRSPNRMDRWKVEDIEAHVRDFGKNAFAVGKCTDGARKHFVPRAEPRTYGIDSYAQFFVYGCICSIGILGGDCSEFFVDTCGPEVGGRVLKLLASAPSARSAGL